MSDLRSRWPRAGSALVVGALALASGFAVGPPTKVAEAAALPSITVADVTVIEGDAGTVTAVFKVTQDKRGKSNVRFATAEGSAKAPGDFIAKSGRLHFAGNKLTKNVAVTVVGDSLDEANETFLLELSAAQGATLADAQGEATITDDDDPPTVSIAASVTVPEGNAGDAPFASVVVTLSEASGRAVSVQYATADGTATTADGDYLAASGSVEFDPGVTDQTVLVQVVGDDADEGTETFDVGLSAPVHATLGDAVAVVTIEDNDPTPPGDATLSIDGGSVREGRPGTTSVVTFTVTRGSELTTAVTVDVTTTNGTATAGEDYVAQTGTPVSFGANETTKTVDVTVNGDGTLEADETFFATLENPSAGATIASGQATGGILNDDTRTTLSIRKRPGRIVARGRLSPASPGKRIVVKLLRRRNGVWVRLATHRALLSGSTDLNGDGITDSTYGTAFARPKPGRCKVNARFRGTNTLDASTAVRTFRC